MSRTVGFVFTFVGALTALIAYFFPEFYNLSNNMPLIRNIDSTTALILGGFLLIVGISLVLSSPKRHYP
ncbi:MAG: hypothetical protein AABX68_00830 [Nanoarchaeota archaeon]